MKFRCECGKLFMYPAKKIETRSKVDVVLQNPNGIIPVTPPQPPETATETHVCPYCGSLNFDEYTEPQPDIYSLRKAALEEVDGLINIGYMVHSVFANHAILVKKEEKKP